jgi:polyisoprenoid-binding protein YceI
VRCDASTAECLVYTFREGLLAAVGHDLCLRVTRFTVEIADDAAAAITAEFDAASLRASGNLNATDAEKIERHTAVDVLDARRHPAITFRSTRVVRDGERARVEGTLTLHGETRPIGFDAVADAAGWRAEIRLDQRDFGIQPFSAMLGTLRVRADVLITLRLPRA